jgi:hypothetical protein
MSTGQQTHRPDDRGPGIEEPPHGGLAHNMSSPPKSVVSFEGLGAGPESNAPSTRKLFGTPIYFGLSDEWLQLRARDFLDLIEERSKPRSRAADEARLYKLIEQRAETMPLPDGCVTTPCKSYQRAYWQRAYWADPLTVLTILTKCTQTVWLRRKSPSLLAAIERRGVCLLVPPAFTSDLPNPMAQPQGKHHDQ